MKAFSCTLVLLVFLANVSYAQNDSTLLIDIPYYKSEIHGYAPCPYNGAGYNHQFVEAPDTIHDYIIQYDLADCITDCKYDSPILRGQLIEYINKLIPFFAPKCTDNKKFSPKGLCLWAWYEFPDSPDFVLLQYRILDIGQLLFVGYVKSTSEWYLLTNFRKASLKENYNRMIKTQGDILNMDPLCRAALILALTFNRRTTVILDSFPDIYPAMVTKGPKSSHFDYPFDSNFYDLYIFNILDHAGILEYADSMENRLGYFKEHLEDIKEKMTERNLSIIPPKITRTQNSTKVVLTAYNSTFMKLTWWQIEFDNSGILLNRQLIDSLTAGYGNQFIFDVPDDAKIEK